LGAKRSRTEREASCCSFFSFVISGTDADLISDISVPPARREILQSLAERARDLSVSPT
jgi:hypothetical protein